MFPSAEALAQRCSLKKAFLEISQNLQENTCARVSFLIKLQASAILLKTRLWHRCFPVNFTKFLITTFSQNTSGGCFCQEYFWITSWKTMFYVYLFLLLQRIRFLNQKVVVVFIRKIQCRYQKMLFYVLAQKHVFSYDRFLTCMWNFCDKNFKVSCYLQFLKNTKSVWIVLSHF